MPTFNTDTPKPGYVYDSSDDTWYPLAGIAIQSLDGLSDVVISSAASGQVLLYNGTNWVNTTETGDISALTSGTGITLTNATGPIPTIAVDDTLVATTSNTMTLSNKTLTTPLISGGTSNTTTVVYPILNSPEERMNISASTSTGTIDVDLATAGILYYTNNSAANHTLNFRFSSTTSLLSVLTSGDSITAAWMNTNGATAYYANVIQVDGTTITPKWQGGTAPSSGNASSVDIYTFTIARVSSTSTIASAVTVFGSQTKFA